MHYFKKAGSSGQTKTNMNDEARNMNDEKVDHLCEDCGQTFSDFLHEMADKNAKVTTCPKCGKIHEFPSKAAQPAAGTRPVKKII